MKNQIVDLKEQLENEKIEKDNLIKMIENQTIANNDLSKKLENTLKDKQNLISQLNFDSEQGIIQLNTLNKELNISKNQLSNLKDQLESFKAELKGSSAENNKLQKDVLTSHQELETFFHQISTYEVLIKYQQDLLLKALKNLTELLKISSSNNKNLISKEVEISIVGFSLIRNKKSF